MKKFAHLLRVMLLWVCVSTAAHADSITFNLANPFQTIYVPAGSGAQSFTIPYIGTITAAATNTDTFYVGGIIVNSGGSPYTSVNSSFSSSFIGPYAPGQSVTGEVFDITIGYVPGGPTIFGAGAIVQGGSSPLTMYNKILSAGATVNVVEVAPAPEPPAWVFAAIGLLMLGLIKGRVWEVGRGRTSVAVAA